MQSPRSPGWAPRAKSATPAAVYLIQRTDRRRFKIGTAIDPIVRARHLPEYSRQALDLRSSLALWLPNPRRANQVERGMHKCLAPFSVSPGHAGDGYSEWFSPAAFPLAIRLLREIPCDVSSASNLGLRPVLVDGARVVAQLFSEPQDVWWTIQDLVLRLADELSVHSETDGATWSLVIGSFRARVDGAMTELRPRVMDVDTFAWHTASGQGNFLRLIEYRGDDLVLTFVSRQVMTRWPDGDNLLLQVRALLARLSSGPQSTGGGNHAR